MLQIVYYMYLRVLMETREMLEEQLSLSRNRADKVLELESEIIKYKQLLNDMALVRNFRVLLYYKFKKEHMELDRIKNNFLRNVLLTKKNIKNLSRRIHNYIN